MTEQQFKELYYWWHIRFEQLPNDPVSHAYVVCHNLINEIKLHRDSLRLIMAYADNPDAAEGCRIIIKTAQELLGEK